MSTGNGLENDFRKQTKGLNTHWLRVVHFVAVLISYWNAAIWYICLFAIGCNLIYLFICNLLQFDIFVNLQSAMIAIDTVYMFIVCLHRHRQISLLKTPSHAAAFKSLVVLPCWYFSGSSFVSYCGNVVSFPLLPTYFWSDLWYCCLRNDCS